MSAQERMTAAELRATTGGPAKRSKYGARRTTVDGITFDSAAEATRYQVLKLKLDMGFIHDLRLQVPYPITVGNGVVVAIYKADFVYVEDGANFEIAEDVKGMDTPVSKLKRKLVEAIHGVKVEIVRAK